jgi:hypothetical protein
MARQLETTIAITTTLVQPFTSAVLGFRPQRLHLEVTDANIRYRYLGGTPTSSAGFALPDGSTLILVDGPQIENLKLIAESGTATCVVAITD